MSDKDELKILEGLPCPEYIWKERLAELDTLLTRVLIAEGSYLPTALMVDIREALEKADE